MNIFQPVIAKSLFRSLCFSCSIVFGLSLNIVNQYEILTQHPFLTILLTRDEFQDNLSSFANFFFLFNDVIFLTVQGVSKRVARLCFKDVLYIGFQR